MSKGINFTSERESESVTTQIMGILNITPDSFSDGGQFSSYEHARQRIIKLQGDGADLLDIGGESSRPGYQEISSEEEIQRIYPIFESLRELISVPVSIDTYKAKTAEYALQKGASIVNDIWGLQYDSEMAHVVSNFGASVIIMHNRHAIKPDLNIVSDIDRFFDQSLGIAIKAGIPSHNIILDPGIGFGKTQEQNLAALRAIPHFKRKGFPILVGASRKSFIHRVTSRPVDQRLAGGLAVHLYACQKGADIIRVHDVKEHCDALRVFHVLETGDF